MLDDDIWLAPRREEAPTESTPVEESDLTLYIGLGVALVVFLLVIVVAARILQKRRQPGGYRLTTSGTYHGSLSLYPFLFLSL